MSRLSKRRKHPVHYAKDNRGRFIPIPIREIRPNYYQLDLYRGDGTRERTYYSDLEEAMVIARQKHTERANFGLSAFSLTGQQRRDALSALELLNGRATLTAAATAWVKMHPANDTETIVTSCARYVRGMRHEGCRRISLKDKLWKFRKFIRYFGKDRLTAGLSLDDCGRFCSAHNYTGTTRRNYERAFRNLLNFYAGNKRGKVRRDEVLPTTWPPATVTKVFRSAEEFYPEALPGLAVLFFCGLRPYEAFRLSWEAVDLAGREITIAPEISKVRSARHVAISPNAIKWLAARRKKEGLVCKGQHVFRRMRQEIMKKAGLERWPLDVTRHTFATAHYAFHGDASRTLKELGHFGSPETFVRHYKGLMSEREAAQFWKIVPAGKPNVIALGA